MPKLAVDGPVEAVRTEWSQGLLKRARGFATWLAVLPLVHAGPTAAAWPMDPATPLAICTAADDQLGPCAVPDESGGLITAWRDFRAGSSAVDVFAQRVDADGTLRWQSGGLPVGDGLGIKVGLAAMADGAGGAFVVWTSEQSSHIGVYVQRIDSGGARAWTPAAGVSVNTGAGSERRPALCSDGAGGVIAVWCQTPGPNTYELHAQRINAAGSRQWTLFPPGDTPLVSAGVSNAMFTDPGPLAALSDGAGGAFVAWNTSGGDIRVQRISSAGAALWGSSGVLACGATGLQFDERMTLDGQGGVVVTWTDRRAGGVLQDDVYAQRLTFNGAALWGANGTVVCDTPGWQANAVIARDTSGGFVVAWRELDVGDIRAQRLDLSGNRLWAPSGVAPCTAAGTRADPVLIEGEGGRILFGWRDLRVGSPGAYVACLDSMGVVCWGGDAAAVGIGPAAADVRDVALLPDGTGGAFAVWRDRRTNVSYDVYGALVSAGGQVGVQTSIESAPRIDDWGLSSPDPNPAACSVRLRFTLGEGSAARLDVFDLAGRRVRRLAAGDWASGVHELVWDGRDDAGRRVAAGIYAVKLAAGSRVATRRVVWLR